MLSAALVMMFALDRGRYANVGRGCIRALRLSPLLPDT